jgi:predicted CXXCH cytochrome family protein
MQGIGAAILFTAFCHTIAAQTGVAACAPCHAAIANSFAQTGMGRSFYAAGPERMTEDFQRNNRFDHALSERHYRMIERDGRYYQRRYQISPNNSETTLIEKEIHYVLGSGNHSRAYLHLTPAGQLVQLPLGWYSEKGGKWAMSPGYDRPDHMDFRRKIDKECLFCHNAYPASGSTTPTSNRDLLFRTPPPLGIDCQRCHSSGERHIAAASAGHSAEAIRAAIVNPARLPKQRQLEVCFQCHLESTSHPLPYSLRRYDREAFSYTPGEPLSAYILHFDHAPNTGRDDKFEISHSAYRLLKSSCFQKSNGQLTCTSCHNPHEPSSTPQAAAAYTQACRNCHASTSKIPEHRANTGCATCHMPKRRTEDAIHVIMTDHRIVRRLPPGDLLAPLQETHDSPQSTYRGDVVPLYPDPLPPADQLYLAVAQVTDGANLDTGISQLEQRLKSLRPREANFYLELGKAYQRKGRHDLALPWLRQAAERNPNLAEARLHESFSLLRLGRPRESVATLQFAITAAPFDPALMNAAGVAYTQSGDSEKAIDVLTRAAALDPDLPETFLNLGFAHFQAKQTVPAANALRNAIRLAPNLAPAHANLATLLNLQGDLPAARYHFEQALRFDPQNAEAALSLGLILFRAGDLPRAVTLYRQALRIKPDLPAAHFNLGLALYRQSLHAEAQPHLEAALKSNPNDHEAHFYLANILLQQGNRKAAATHFRKAAATSSPQLRTAAEEAIHRLTKPIN